LPTVVATLIEMNAPAKLNTPAISTAVRAVSARVDTVVAMALAASWNPLVKSKNSANAITASSVTFRSMTYLPGSTGRTVTASSLASDGTTTPRAGPG
jgi:homoserine dehydrogenase